MTDLPINEQAIFIAGPTAVGKSAVALYLAEQVNGEIISVDSMQVYCQLNIGTAKPNREECQRVPHHLINSVPLTEPFSVAQYVTLARQAAQDIFDRGHRPIYCGGTGLYFKALLEGLSTAPPPDPALRSSLEALPLEVLLAELEQRDPQAYLTIDRQNPRRVIRALEVVRQTGRPLAEAQAQWRRGSLAAPNPPNINETRSLRLIGLRRDTADLRQRIEERVDRMFAQGLIEETRLLLDRGLRQNRTAMQAIGYRQVVAYLEGQCSLEQTVAEIKARTHQFAKRQMTWFRHQLPLDWRTLSAQDSPESVAEQLTIEYSYHQN